jgi:cystathionine beta-lyase/cystathionine gamma-synthase
LSAGLLSLLFFLMQKESVMKKVLGFSTRAIHAGYDHHEHNRAVMPPLYQSSAFAHDSVGEALAHSYSRVSNPTRSVLEKSIASLENAAYGLAFSSGMATIDAVLRATLKPGDEIIAVADLYGGTYRLLTKILQPLGVTVIFADLTDAANLAGVLSDKTRVVWLESPTNPLLNLVDISALSGMAHAHNPNIVVVVDNTFATPYLQNPLDLGADVSVHSATKYLGGHSDVLLGVLAVNDEALYQAIRFVQYSTGAVPGPQDCFLVIRGLKTLSLRMDRHEQNAQVIARFLSEHPAIEHVFYPALPSHPQHELAKRQMRGSGGIITVYLKNNTQAAASDFAGRLRLFVLAESLGGVESLINHSWTMSHGAMPADEKQRLGIKEGGLRLSIGIEDLEDLLADIEQALV